MVLNLDGVLKARRHLDLLSDATFYHEEYPELLELIPVLFDGKVYRIPVEIVNRGEDMISDWVEWMSPYYEEALCWETLPADCIRPVL